MTEKKFYAVSSATANNVTNAWLINDLFAPAQGITDLTRIGDKCRPVHLSFKYYIETGTTDRAVVRLLIVKWMTNTLLSGAPTATDILYSVGSVNGQFQGPLNQDTKKDFKILADRRILMSTDTGSAHHFQMGSISKKLHGNVEFDTAATTGYGKIYSMAYSNMGAGAGAPTMTSFSMIHFIDL